MNDNDSNLGQRILDLRTKNKISQSVLADKVETTRTTISKWENGESEPSASQLKKIGDVFGVSTDYLLGNFNGAGERICVLDTCVALQRPKAVDLLVKSKLYAKIIIPDVVIQELNFQKDKGKNSIKQKAWLAMTTIESNRDKLFFEDTMYDKDKINDDKIIDVAKNYALENSNNEVHILTDDVYFSLKHKIIGVKNLSINSLNEIEKTLYKNDGFDEFNTQNFISEIKNKNLDKVKKAYNPSVDVNRIDSQTGRTPLILAIREKSYDIIEYLLTLEGIDTEKRDEEKYNFTPLLHCCQLKDVNAMKILINNGANVNSSSRGRNKGNNPLMVCCWGAFNDGIKLLMESDSLSYNQQDSNGFTALHKACIKNNYTAIELLIKKIDKNIEDFDNKKAVEYLDHKSKYFDRISELFQKKI